MSDEIVPSRDDPASPAAPDAAPVAEAAQPAEAAPEAAPAVVPDAGFLADLEAKIAHTLGLKAKQVEAAVEATVEKAKEEVKAVEAEVVAALPHCTP